MTEKHHWDTSEKAQGALASHIENLKDLLDLGKKNDKNHIELSDVAKRVVHRAIETILKGDKARAESLLMRTLGGAPVIDLPKEKIQEIIDTTKEYLEENKDAVEADLSKKQHPPIVPVVQKKSTDSKPEITNNGADTDGVTTPAERFEKIEIEKADTDNSTNTEYTPSDEYKKHWKEKGQKTGKNLKIIHKGLEQEFRNTTLKRSLEEKKEVGDLIVKNRYEDVVTLAEDLGFTINTASIIQRYLHVGKEESEKLFEEYTNNQTLKKERFKNLKKGDILRVWVTNSGEKKITIYKILEIVNDKVFFEDLILNRKGSISLKEMEALLNKKGADFRIENESTEEIPGTEIQNEEVSEADDEEPLKLSNETEAGVEDFPELDEMIANYFKQKEVLEAALTERDEAKQELEICKQEDLQMYLESIKRQEEVAPITTPIQKLDAKEVEGTSSQKEYKPKGKIEIYFTQAIDGVISTASMNSQENTSAWGIENTDGNFYVSTVSKTNEADIAIRNETYIKPLFNEENKPNDTLRGKNKIFILKPARLQKNTNGSFSLVEKGLVRYDNLESMSNEK